MIKKQGKIYNYFYTKLSVTIFKLVGIDVKG